MIELWTKEREEDRRYSFGIFLNENDELIGEISLFDVVRGPMMKCILGYCLDEQQNGKGYMTEALHLIMKFAFKEANFHRIEAGVMPHNVGSIRVLEKAGFKKEGYARKNVLYQWKLGRSSHVLRTS